MDDGVEAASPIHSEGRSLPAGALPLRPIIVFLGNCQVQAIGDIIKRFVAPYVPMTIEFIDAYQNVNQSSYDRLRRADIVITQSSLNPPRLGDEHIPPGAAVHKVPLVSGAFFWPYHCVAHPLNPTARYGNPPYTPEYNDRYLVRLIAERHSPGEALARYQEFDVAREARVGRLFQLTLENQRKIDSICGYATAPIIEGHLEKYSFATRVQ